MLKKILYNFEEIIASLFMIATLLLVVLNIIMRYFLKTGIPWSEEVATGCFVWTVFIGAAAVYKKRQHIGIDVIFKHFDEYGRKKIQMAVDVLLLIVIVFLTVLSIKYVYTTYTKPTPVLEISSAYISLAISCGFVLMTVRSLQFIFYDCKEFIGGKHE